MTIPEVALLVAGAAASVWAVTAAVVALDDWLHRD